ncbi:MAG: glycoside hydrolase family 3 N-terminal domain-containing protein [Chlamydiota bacterium]
MIHFKKNLSLLLNFIGMVTLSAPLLLLASTQDVQRILSSMTVEEKIGQLFMVPACPMRGEDHQKDLERLIHDFHVGGVIVKQATPDKQVAFLDMLQTMSKVSLLVGIDAEWGLGMRMKETISFPKNMTLGAIKDEKDLFSLGQEIGRECRLIGAHINFAPVVDVNVQPKNPIIGMRSFGEDPNVVARKASCLMKCLQTHMLAIVKLFPGLGDVIVDSHEDLPVVQHSLEEFWSIDLISFQELIKHNVSCIMSSHLVAVAFDKVPCTFSRVLIQNILREKMGFSGLIITDALNMKALRNYFPIEEIGWRALQSGHDILLYGDHIAPNVDEILREEVPRAYQRIYQGVIHHEISMKELDSHVFRILEAKDRLGILQRKPLIKKDLSSLQSIEAMQLKEKLYSRAMTWVGNPYILQPKEGKIGDLEIGHSKNRVVFEGLQKQGFVSELSSLEKYTCVVVAIYSLDPRQENFGMSSATLESLQKLSSQIPVIAVVFGTPYVYPVLSFLPSILMAYEEEKEAQLASLEVLLGRRQGEGVLPIYKKIVK